LGPVSAFVPFSWAMADMPRRRFMFWNAASAVPYALILPAIGYYMGDLLALIGPQTGRALLLILIALSAFAGLWFFANRVRRNLPNLMNAATRLQELIVKSPAAQKFAVRWPRLTRFVAHRLDRAHFSGLTVTLLSVAALYVATLYADSVLDFIQSDTITQVDQRVASLLFVLRDLRLIQLFSSITALGDATVISVLLIGSVVAFLLNRHWAAAIGMTVAVVGNVLSVMLLKSFFARPRPPFAYFAETSGSFPSGHAAISISFYGMLAFTLWRQRLIDPVLALLFALGMAFAISLSRVYLVVHYLSDVINGAVVGTMWLLIAIAVSEWWRARSSSVASHSTSPILSKVVWAGAVLLAAISVATYSHPRAFPKAEHVAIISNTDEISGLLPLDTKSLVGANNALISVVFLTKDMSDAATQLATAGWVVQQTPGLAAAIKTAFEGNTSDETLTADASMFWNGQPVVAVLTKQNSSDSPNEMILRLWPTLVQLADGAHVIVGSVQGVGTDGIEHWVQMLSSDLGVTVPLNKQPYVIRLH
jgi:membrane-associated phospholipid phosphatase